MARQFRVSMNQVPQSPHMIGATLPTATIASVALVGGKTEIVGLIRPLAIEESSAVGEVVPFLLRIGNVVRRTIRNGQLVVHHASRIVYIAEVRPQSCVVGSVFAYITETQIRHAELNLRNRVSTLSQLVYRAERIEEIIGLSRGNRCSLCVCGKLRFGHKRKIADH